MPIPDREKLEAWLEKQDHQTKVWSAARCALRGMPLLHTKPDGFRADIALVCFRALVIAAAAAECSASEMKKLEFAAHLAEQAARTAANSANSAESSHTFPASAAAHAVKAVAFSSAHASNAALAAAASAANCAESWALSVEAAVANYSAAYSAAIVDSQAAKTWSKLWHDAEMPGALSQCWAQLDAVFAADPEIWGFWREWYTAILNGAPLDWELSFRIATELSEEDWEKGAAHVAQLIEPIWREYRDPPLDQDALKAHLAKVVSQPLIFADAAESTANQIIETVARFKNEEPKTNRLPDGFELFEKDLPQSYARMSVILRSSYDTRDQQISDLQAEVNRLNGLVHQLRNDLSDARHALSEAKLTQLEAQHVRTLGERLQTTLTNVTLIGTIGISTLTFFGIRAEDLRYEMLKDQLQGLAEEMASVKSPTDDARMESSLRPQMRPNALN